MASTRHEREGALRLLLDNAQDTVFRVRLRPELCVEYVSPSCEALTGYRAEEWYANPRLPLDVVHPDDRPVVEAALEGSPGTRDVTRWRRRDGALVWVETERRVLHDAEGRPEIVEGVGRDVTARVIAEEEAKRARALFEAAFMQAPVGMALTTTDPDHSHGLVEVNTALCRLLGRTREELLTRPLDEFTHPDDRGRVVEPRRRLMRGEIPSFTLEKRYVRGDGTVVWAEVRGSLVRDADGRPIYGLGHIEDISDRIAHQHSLQHRALHDALTDLPNRQLFLDRLDHALAQRPDGTHVGVLFADLDDLKDVNDSYGHGAGDVVLREVGRRFAETVRPGDTVGRFSGDEFTVLCPELPGVEALEGLGRRLLAAIAEPVVFQDRPLPVAASFGAALAVPGERTADELLAEADAALLEAKRGGKARVRLFDERLGTSVRRRRSREAEVRAAAEHGEFELHY